MYIICEYHPDKNSACVHGSTNGANGIPISLKVIPMVPLVMVPLVNTLGSQYCRQSTVWAKLPNCITNGTIGRTLNDIGIPLVPLVEP